MLTVTASASPAPSLCANTLLISCVPISASPARTWVRARRMRGLLGADGRCGGARWPDAAVQADGAQVVTIEGLADTGEIADLQAAFVERNALQCGFCTPGMLMTAAEMLREPAPRSREQIRTFLSGNYCRCTGYHAIVRCR